MANQTVNVGTINVNLEDILIKEVAGKILAQLSEEEKSKILKDAIASKLTIITDFWELCKVVEAEVLRLAAEYMKQPDIQQKMRETAIAKVDELMTGLIDMFGKSLEDWAKTEYKRILKVKEK